jgi:hypothetical protein
MKFLNSIVGATVLMGGQTWASGAEGEYYEGGDYEYDAKFRGRFEGELHIAREKFHGLLKEKQGKGYLRSCAEACFRTPSCRFDPHQHWSYCKTDNHPAVCFGLYHVPRGEHKSGWNWGEGHRFGRLCYQPNSPHCPERFPLFCHKHDYLKRFEEDGLSLDGFEGIYE